MPLIAVSGIPGAGKSTVYARLKQLRPHVFGTDEDGLASWVDVKTLDPVAAPSDWADPVATAGIEYRVLRHRVEALRPTDERVVYICGFGGDEWGYRDLFDVWICLAVDTETLGHRLATRTTNSFGKAAHQRAATLAANEGWAEHYWENGAIVIDSTQPLDSVVAAVIRAAEGSS